MHNLENLTTYVQRNDKKVKMPVKSRHTQCFLFGIRPGKKSRKDITEHGEVIKGVYFDQLTISFLKKALIGDDQR